MFVLGILIGHVAKVHSIVHLVDKLSVAMGHVSLYLYARSHCKKLL